MTPQNEAIFAPLRAAILESTIMESDIFDGIAALILQDPAHAISFTLHMRDIMREYESNPAGPEMTYNDLAVETYRRSYFDHDTVQRHGGSLTLANDHKRLSQFVQFVSSRMAQDAIDPSATPARVHSEPATVQ